MYVTFGRAGGEYFTGAGDIGPTFITVPEGTSDLGNLLIAAGTPRPPPDWKAAADTTYAPQDAYVIFRDTEGNPLPPGSVTEIRINTTTNEIDDIIVTPAED